MGQTLPLDFGQELDEDKLLSLAFETLHHHTMADALKTDEDCLNHLAGNCPCGLLKVEVETLPSLKLLTEKSLASDDQWSPRSTESWS